jgi:hypothetical protein
MAGSTAQQMQIGVSPAALIAGAVCLLALPSAVLAFAARFEPHADSLSDHNGMGAFTPAAVDPRLARQISVADLPQGQVFRFTPAGISTQANRPITVAVRVDAETARAVALRKGVGASQTSMGMAQLRIAPTAYSLGGSRSNQGFALGKDIRRIEMPDLSAYVPNSGAPDSPSRFNPRLVLEAREKAGSAPRTFEASGEQTVDLGGSYRLGKNLDVTAGVRYSKDRDRLLPLTDGRQDGQAVYVGTQFRF